MSPRGGRPAPRAPRPVAAHPLDDTGLRDLYVRILRGRPRSTAELRAIAPRGHPLADALERLEAAGLVAVGRDGLEIADPRQAVVERARDLLTERSAQWDAAAADTAGLEGLMAVWRASERARLARSTLAGAVIEGDARALREAAEETGPLCIAATRLPTPDREALLVHAAEREGPGGVRLLLPVGTLAGVGARDHAAALEEAGVRVCLASVVDGFLLVGARAAALAFDGHGGGQAGVVLSRDAVIRAVLQATFDARWSRAVPFAGLDALPLLALGCDDGEIARSLGISIRTVHRRIAQSMAATGARSRFQLGVMWARSREGRGPARA